MSPPQFLLTLPILIGAVVMLRWFAAYRLYPFWLSFAIDGAKLGAFAIITNGAARFIRLCANSHAVMAGQMLLMAGMPFISSPAYQWACAIYFWAALILYIYGGEFSLLQARLMRQEAPKIRQALTEG